MEQKTKVRCAVIPAAGLGTRLLPATKAVPKEMLPIVDVPIIQLVVEEALAAGIETIILVTGRGKGAIDEHFDYAFELERTLADRNKEELLALCRDISRRVRLISVRQKEPLGLGHAVLSAEQAAGGQAVAVLLGDNLYDTDGVKEGSGIKQLCDIFTQLGGQSAVVAVQEVAPGQEHLYGIVSGTEVAGYGGRVKFLSQMVEKPPPGTAPGRDAIVGRYVLPSSIWQLLRETRPGRDGEIQLTDALATLMSFPQGGCYGYCVDGVRHDAGERLGYLGANLAYALKRSDLRPGLLHLMRQFFAAYDR